jgi:hypothetical protein
MKGTLGDIDKPSSVSISERYAILRTANNEIWKDDAGIVHIRSIEPGYVMELEETRECFEIYRQMECDKVKCLQLMDIRNSISMSKEGRDYAAMHGKNFFIASAIVSNSLAVRLLVNFYNKFYRHEVPFRMFGSMEDAYKWLRKFKSS